MILKNLEHALNTAFKGQVFATRTSDQNLTIQIGAVELLIDDSCNCCLVSGVGGTRLEINVDNIGGGITTARPTVEIGV